MWEHDQKYRAKLQQCWLTQLEINTGIPTFVGPRFLPRGRLPPDLTKANARLDGIRANTRSCARPRDRRLVCRKFNTEAWLRATTQGNMSPFDKVQVATRKWGERGLETQDTSSLSSQL